MSEPLSLIIPIYNEEGNLIPLYERILEGLEGREFEILMVNDGSTDGSMSELEQLAERDPRVRVVHFVRNYGQTAALTAGIRCSQFPLLVTLDADLQNDPLDIPAMVERLDEGYDIVCGWRKDRQDALWTRNLPSWMANKLISKLSNVHLHDYGCTLRVYRREYIADIPLYGEMHRFIPIYVTWAGARLVEMPVRHHPRVRGVSKYNLWRIPKVLLDLTTVKFLRDFYVTPIYFFGWMGFGLALLGLGLGASAALAWSLGWDPNWVLGLSVVSPVLVCLGLVEITLGIIAEVLIRMHYDIRDKAPYRIRSTRNLELPEG